MDAARQYGLHTVTLRSGVDHILTDEAGVLGWGGNSGFHALNLAVQFRAKRIVLVGYDMSVAHGVHWFGRHPARMNNPDESNVKRWARVLDDQAPRLAELGVEVLNASPISALTAYRRVTLEEVFC